MKARALAALLALAACAPLPRLEAPEVVSVAVLNVEVRLPNGAPLQTVLMPSGDEIGPQSCDATSRLTAMPPLARSTSTSATSAQ